ncbi:uncharacterized protein BXIN_1056 [Babesia sp. Xinjiang]|uniref:uncharacterized protein n=1 Tax=Babesia sp. Xinjiang TaxID=462227 RepID=UPI000A23320F|nr:uncharacterized protein BXIN_1056 [Babesia sp. Xinjiang]ORM41990.1 hypothetical protein BXIN_1056 [Babesia sp. Xinjiang]
MHNDSRHQMRSNSMDEQEGGLADLKVCKVAYNVEEVQKDSGEDKESVIQVENIDEIDSISQTSSRMSDKQREVCQTNDNTTLVSGKQMSMDTVETPGVVTQMRDHLTHIAAAGENSLPNSGNTEITDLRNLHMYRNDLDVDTTTRMDVLGYRTLADDNQKINQYEDANIQVVSIQKPVELDTELEKDFRNENYSSDSYRSSVAYDSSVELTERSNRTNSSKRSIYKPVFIAEPFGTVEGNIASANCESVILQDIAANSDGGFDISTHIRDVDQAKLMIKCDKSANGNIVMELVCNSSKSNTDEATGLNTHCATPVSERENGPKDSSNKTDTVQETGDKKYKVFIGPEDGTLSIEIARNLSESGNNTTVVRDEFSTNDDVTEKVNVRTESENSYMDTWIEEHRNMFLMGENENLHCDSPECRCHWGLGNIHLSPCSSHTLKSGGGKTCGYGHSCEGSATCNCANGGLSNSVSSSFGMTTPASNIYGSFNRRRYDSGNHLQRRLSDCCENVSKDMENVCDSLFKKSGSIDVIPHDRSDGFDAFHPQNIGSGFFGLWRSCGNESADDGFEIPRLPMYDVVGIDKTTPRDLNNSDHGGCEKLECVDSVPEKQTQDTVPTERILFYAMHGTNYQHVYTTTHPEFKHTADCTVTPQELGFDSAESLNRSLNAKSEIIVRPPACLGGPVCFRANVAKSILCSQDYMTNTVFQVNWYENSLQKKRSASCWLC